MRQNIGVILLVNFFPLLGGMQTSYKLLTWPHRASSRLTGPEKTTTRFSRISSRFGRLLSPLVLLVVTQDKVAFLFGLFASLLFCYSSHVFSKCLSLESLPLFYNQFVFIDKYG